MQNNDWLRVVVQASVMGRDVALKSDANVENQANAGKQGTQMGQ